MCTRYLLVRPATALAAALGVDEVPLPKPRYNAAPRQPLPVVRRRPSAPGREVATLRWGLVPAWSPTPERPALLLNARAETLAAKPAFRDAFRQRRCLVPADGFYEWQRTPGGPMPWLFEHTGADLLLLAGLWERWSGPGAEPFESFALVTTTPNPLVAPFHDRMPVILPPAHAEAWLDPATPPARLESLLVPFPAAALRARPVHPRLNNVAHDDPACLAPPPPVAQLDLGLG